MLIKVTAKFEREAGIFVRSPEIQPDTEVLAAKLASMGTSLKTGETEVSIEVTVIAQAGITGYRVA